MEALTLDAGEVVLIRIGSSFTATPGTGVLSIADRPAILPNTSCTNPALLTGEVDVAWSNLGALSSTFSGGGNPCKPGTDWYGPNWDLFYEWTAVEAGTFVIDTAGTGANSVLQLHDGSGCSALCYERIEDEDVLILDDLQVGDTILIQVGSVRQGGIGPQPIFDGLFSIYGYDQTLNDDCSTPTTIAGSGPWPFSTLGMGSSGFDGGSFACQPATSPIIICVQRLFYLCYPDGYVAVANDQFFVWTAPCNGPFEIYAQSGPEFTYASVYSGTDCSAVCLGSSPVTPAQSLSFGALAGDQFLIQIGRDTTANAIAEGTFEIRRTAGPCTDGLTITCDPPEAHYLGGAVSLANSAWAGAGASGLHIEATDGPPSEFGFFLIAPTAASSLSVFNGTLCLDAPLGRYNAQIADNQGLSQLNSIGLFDGSGVLQNLAGSSASGSGFDVPVELPYSPAGQVIAPGDTWAIQLWYRDQTGIPGPLGSTANFSNVLLATFP